MAIEKNPFDGLELLGSGTTFSAKIGDMLERADMFRDMTRQEVDIFAGYVQAYNAPVGAEVLHEGMRESYMFIVAQGRLDILKQTADYGESRKIATVRAGKTIGEMSLLDGLPHSATARVVEPAVLLLLTKSRFEQVVAEQPEVALKMIRKMATLMSLRLRQTSGVLIDYLKS
ncbi:hypothetical protein Tel_01935 [Candidatus Tenderia electrophaga]|jgi:CRP-like cAMP-binding protein|uniref:Cyclic nucleotide-binding domain-containing protein n=1 Tax=Candidatus Tenderia electrophaga TaxID=1748243 RepID=A0A0S2TA30_9GAMM|nr:hypothetical protein Tel_01935 [Candidatus Tenderia electrophaga]